MEIAGSNVNQLFPETLWYMKTAAVVEESRNGKVKTLQHPITLCTLHPEQRVIFCKERQENPVFHFAECLWMMAGRNDASWLAQFNPRMAEFAEANGRFHGAYGDRWFHHFGVSQVLEVCDLLKKDPWTRRAVIAMWDPQADLDMPKKDLPCNTHIYFRRRGHCLDMTVCNRSNDLVWGCLGSNIVHFSFLMELIAHEVGLEMGKMYQFTNNLHVYERHWRFLDVPPYCEAYQEVGVLPYKIIQGALKDWIKECEEVVKMFGAERKTIIPKYREPFFNSVALPILSKKYSECEAPDWRLACERFRARKEGI